MIDTPFIQSKNDLINYFVQGNKPETQWRIGTEHEKLLFDQQSCARVSYEKGIEEILTQLQSFGWQPILEHTKLIGLQRGNASISLEPGGQFELSGAPLTTIHEIRDELDSHLFELKCVAHTLGIRIVGLGVDPISNRNHIPWMPKERYRLMRQYMPTKGVHGLDMMTATCTVQVNLDFSSEEDMALKFKVAMALQPLATALFANSSVKEGKDSGYASYRAAIWQDTDPDRCGLLPFVFEPSFNFEKYVDYALSVPMYFVKRDDIYISALGLSFYDFLQGKLSILPGELPTLKDWEDHLSTLFPEVRLKRYLELRGTDAGTSRHVLALPAFWVGLLYDKDNLQEVYDIIKNWTYDDLKNLYYTVPRLGLNADFQQRKLREWGQQFLKISQKGLKCRNFKDSKGLDETNYLAYLEERLISFDAEETQNLEAFIQAHTF
ncbi:MAG: glutamate--cysteine ligase [Caedibacter sp. 38-128]|nr:glutamate--cysteine ligase [Holosporales bacterium]OJX04876.1 MAG: glutamate--cysteine ligase [Caedibacter sp. 38-128]